MNESSDFDYALIFEFEARMAEVIQQDIARNDITVRFRSDGDKSKTDKHSMQFWFDTEDDLKRNGKRYAEDVVALISKISQCSTLVLAGFPSVRGSTARVTQDGNYVGDKIVVAVTFAFMA